MNTNEETVKSKRRYFPLVISLMVCICLLFYVVTMLGHREDNVNEKQKELLKDNWIDLNKTIHFGKYGIQLDGAVYDETNLYIPYSITDMKGNVAFTEPDEMLFHVNGKKDCIESNNSLIHIKNAVGKNIKGALVFTSKVPLKKGDIIELVEGDGNKKETGKVFTKFKLTKDTPKLEHEIDLSNIKFKKDVIANKIIMSPLAISLEGTFKEYTFDDKTVKVILKDKTEVELGQISEEPRIEDGAKGKKPFKCKIQFEYPVDLSQVKEIAMGLEMIDLDVTIPYKVK